MLMMTMVRGIVDGDGENFDDCVGDDDDECSELA